MIDAQSAPTDRDQRRAERETVLAGLGQFQSASIQRSLLQVTTTLFAYLATLVAMYAALPVSIWLTLALALPAAGFVVPLFIIHHDFGLASYFSPPQSYASLGRL